MCIITVKTNDLYYSMLNLKVHLRNEFDVSINHKIRYFTFFRMNFQKPYFDFFTWK